MLNRQNWDAKYFNELLAALVGASQGDRVLDIGCGRGASFGPLLAAVGSDGHVVGLDRLGRFLDEAARDHAPTFEMGRLTLVQGDALDLPFPDMVFDAVLCQNVAECVHDRKALIAHAKRTLKPGGRFLLGHHDFDGIMLASEDRDLTRRLVHSYADHQQAWQEACEGQIGRMLPGLVADAGFASVEVETRIFVDLDLEDGS